MKAPLTRSVCALADPPRRQALQALLGAAATGFVPPVWGQPAQLAGGPAAPPSRMALVIANARYPGAALKNPPNDARLMLETVSALGFQTTLVTDATKVRLIDALRGWLSRARRADVRLLYFVGHGAQYRGRNYLLPVDAELRSEDDLPGVAVEADGLADTMSRLGEGANLLVLDACRSVPLIMPPEGTRRDGRQASAPAPGLAPFAAPRGTLVAYATAPGAYASDEPQASNGLYAQHLARELRAPGQPIEEVFKRTRAAVVQASRGAQVPWEASSLVGNLCLAGACPATR